MNKKLLFYILSILIGLVLVISTCIVITKKIRSNNSNMTVQLEKYREKINTLEDRINVYQNSETKLNSLNSTLQQSLNEANELNKILESQVKENNVSNEVTENYYGDYQGNDDFSDIINDNPIDKDYRIEFKEYQENSKSTTLGWSSMAVRYTKKWQEEINAALEYLYNSLSEQDSLNLKQSQKSWQTSIDDDFNFVVNKFIFTGDLGTRGMSQSSTVELCRTRDRAIQLMEYIFILDRTAVDFVYDN